MNLEFLFLLGLVGTGSRWRAGIGYLPPGHSAAGKTGKTGVLGADGEPDIGKDGKKLTEAEKEAIRKKDEEMRDTELGRGKKEPQGKPFNNKTYQQSLQKNEAAIRTNEYETGIIFDGDGNVLFNITQGHPDKVVINKEQFLALKGNVFTHNHPNGASFSPADLGVLYGSQALEARAVGSTGVIYSATLNPNFRKWDGKHPEKVKGMIQSAFTRETNKQIPKVRQLQRAGKIKAEDVNLGLFHVVNKKLASRNTNPFQYSVSGDPAELAKLERLERLIEGA